MQVNVRTESLDSSDNAENTAGDQIASELNDGLKSCRAVLDDYRAKLSGIPHAANSNEEEEGDRLASD